MTSFFLLIMYAKFTKRRQKYTFPEEEGKLGTLTGPRRNNWLVPSLRLYGFMLCICHCRVCIPCIGKTYFIQCDEFVLSQCSSGRESRTCRAYDQTKQPTIQPDRNTDAFKIFLIFYHRQKFPHFIVPVPVHHLSHVSYLNSVI